MHYVLGVDNKIFNCVNLLARTGRAFSVAAALPVCGPRYVSLPQQSVHC